MSAAAAVLLASTTGPLAAGETGATDSSVMPHIDAVLGDPRVIRRIEAWGLSLADVRHDVDAMTPLERVRLAYVLTRRWHDNDSHSQSDLQAQFLVTMSLMRESTLFASILSTGPSRLR